MTAHTILAFRNLLFREDPATGTVYLDAPSDPSDFYNQPYFNTNYISPYHRKKHIYDSLAQRFIDKPGINLLDIGCGVGFFLRAALNRQAAATGIEPSLPAVEHARKLCPDAQSIILADPLAADLPDQSFDVITILDVLAHVDRPPDLLRWPKAKLKPNGRLIVKTPNHPPEFYRFIADNYPQNHPMIADLAHLPYQRFGWGITQLARTLESFGFTDIQTEYFSEAVDEGKPALTDIWHPRRVLYKHRLRQIIARFPHPSILAVASR